MKIFSYPRNGAPAIILAFNRGHAVKMLAKELEAKGEFLDKNIPITEIDVEGEKKGRVIFLEMEKKE